MSQSRKTIHDYSVKTQLQVLTAPPVITLGQVQSGGLIVLNFTGGSVVTLPNPIPGLDFSFVVNTTAAHSIVSPSPLIVGAINVAILSTVGNLVTGSAKTSISSTTGSVVGDNFKIRSDGILYYLSGTCSAYNGVKLA